MDYHYIYRLIALNPMDSREFYVGVRTCKCDPEDDQYMSSSKEVAKAIKNGVIFQKKILATCETRADAVAMEIAYHNYYNIAANPKSFNLVKQTSTGFDTTGIKFTNEQKAKRSKAMQREDVRKKLSVACSGWSHTEKAKQKISAASKGNQHALGIKQSEETKKKRALSLIGKKRTPEQRENISKACMGRTLSQEHKNAVRNARLGTKQSAELIAKRSAAIKLSWQKRKENDSKRL